MNRRIMTFTLAAAAALAVLAWGARQTPGWDGFRLCVTASAEERVTPSASEGYDNGKLTMLQVIEMQRYYGASVDGKWGSNSREISGGLSADAAWAKYQAAKTASTAAVGYDNGTLTVVQVAEMQRYYGAVADGKWGANSRAATNGLGADAAWEKYQEAKVSVSYNNGALTAAQVVELQRYYGVTADGRWSADDKTKAGGLDADAAWEKYQTAKTAVNSARYDNGSLTTTQVAEMQRYYGASVDGLWGANSKAKAGGLSADEAWRNYQAVKAAVDRAASGN